MCGIFGFSLTRPLNDEDLKLGRRAVEMLHHRGPDGRGEWFDEKAGIFLGHTRLAILDLTKEAQQPFKRVESVVTYNGEIYNYRELKRSLSPYESKSTGDTEVLLELWRQKGYPSLAKMDGMFAFGIYDGKSLHLACDAFGEKPVYYARTKDGFYFCSEPGPLIELLGLVFELNEQQSTEFLALGFIRPPETGYRNLKLLPPAGYMQVVSGSIVQKKTYWQFPESTNHSGVVEPLTEALLDDISDELVKSLKRRLVADVPVGLFLSGGIDSSLIAALLAFELNEKVETFTVAFPDGADESKLAAQIAKHCGLPHTCIDSRDSTEWEQAPNYVSKVYGVPNDNLTVAAVFQMSKLVRERIKVALSGLGGDEMFFGYNKYWFLYEKRFAYRYLSPLFSRLGALDDFLGAINAWSVARRMLRRNSGEQFLAIKNGGVIDELSGLPSFSRVARSLLPNSKLDLYQRARIFDVNATLPGSYIPSVDRGSMQASLEVRTPFLSVSLAERLARVDCRSLIDGGLKITLKKLVDRYLPRDFWDQPKQGFVFPVQRYLAHRADNQGPKPALIPDEFSSVIWNRRRQPSYDAYAFRLCILESMGRTS